MKDIKNIFFEICPYQILLEIESGKSYSMILAKKLDFTDNQVIKIIHRFRDIGLLRLERKGRKQIIHLTNNGRLVKRYVRGVIDILAIQN